MNIANSITLITILFVSSTNPAKILGLFSFPDKNHFIVLKAIMIELSTRGHEVTVISNFKIHEKIQNYTEITLDPPLDNLSTVTFDGSTNNSLESINTIGNKAIEHFLSNHHVQSIIRNCSIDKYDLIIVEQFYQDALLMVAHLCNTPVVAITSLSIENYFSSMLTGFLPWDHSFQNGFTNFGLINFWEILQNSFMLLKFEYNRKFIYYPQQDAIIYKYFKHISGIMPAVSELKKSVSLLLVNSLMPLDVLPPCVEGFVYVGGVHVVKPKTLIWDIRRFCDDAPNGVILFSLGTNLKSSDVEIIKIILNVFRKMKERILWEFNEDMLHHNIPNNVKTKKVISKNDVLAHPHVKYCITSGDLLNLQEAIYRNIPILGIPKTKDQHINMKKLVKLGIAIDLDFSNVTEISFTWAMQKLLQDITYVNQMHKMSKTFRDRPMGPMETAIYWIDYVIRYNGTKHLNILNNKTFQISWSSIYLISIIYILFSFFFVTILVLFLLRKVVSMREKHVKINVKLN